MKYILFIFHISSSVNAIIIISHLGYKDSDGDKALLRNSHDNIADEYCYQMNNSTPGPAEAVPDDNDYVLVILVLRASKIPNADKWRGFSTDPPTELYQVLYHYCSLRPICIHTTYHIP